MSEQRTYANPVYDDYLADPFVLEHRGEYYAYGTPRATPGAIPVLRSRDLVSWERVGEALQPPGPGLDLWAPEVAYADGTFYMYYSSGGLHGAGHQLRVATSRTPEGPFVPEGGVLAPDDPFTIDAHPFRDEDGRWYLFYCRDFLEGGRVGTGIVVDRLVDMRTLAGEPTTVARAHAEWQLFEAQRDWAGRVGDWYTVEGPWVRKRLSSRGEAMLRPYYCFYSGGRWERPNYGVSYAVAPHPLGPWESVGGTEGPEVLRTVPGRVLGPGHACVVVGPDLSSEYIVYHAWDPDQTARTMRVDPLSWDGDTPSSPGPTLDPRPAPRTPLFRDLFDGVRGAPPDPGSWTVRGGDWRVEDGELAQRDATAGTALAVVATPAPEGGYLFAAHARLMGGSGEFGVCFGQVDSGSYVAIAFGARSGRARALWLRDGRVADERELSLAALGSGFRAEQGHAVRVRVRDGAADVWVDGVLVGEGLAAPDGTHRVGLWTDGASAAFDGVSVSDGE